MSKTVDERVVSMQFDNAQFEKNVSTSMSTIDKLKQKLRFDNSTKGLENVSKSVKNVDMSSLSKSVETVSSKFSALEVMGVTALANLTNSAVNYGKRMLAAFTIDPVKTGFNEYELKMGSVQTIMASTGAKLEDVNKYLAELNEYSDKTIYSFSDMTNSIGKFTNAGVKLEDAVLAIKGISNEAALSGANANEASRAMYNFSQALSSGYVKLIDWKSIENANMATVQFKQELINTAVEVGTLKKRSDGLYATSKHNISATKDFNDSLQDQWMTTDVLIKTLAKYADENTDIGKKAYDAAQDVKTFSMMMDTLKEAAQSGWAETWELLVGDFEEAKTLWTDLSSMFGDAIAKSAKSRNDFIKNVFGGGGSKWSDLTAEIEKTGISVTDFEEKFKEVARSHGIAIDEMIKEEGSLANVISSGKIKQLPSLIKETFKKFLDGGMKVSKTTKDITTNFEHMQEMVIKVIRGEFGSGVDRVNRMAAAGENYAKTQALVNYIWERNGHTWKDCTLTAEEMTAVLSKMSDEELKSVGYTEDQIKAFRELAEQAEKTGTPINELIENLEKPSGRELVIDTLRNLIKSLIAIKDSIKNAWTDIFPPENAAKGLYNALTAIHNLSEAFLVNDDRADQLKRTFKGLFAIIDLIRMVVGGGLSIAFKIVKAIFGAFNVDVLEGTACIGDAIVKFRDWIKEHDILGKAISFVVSHIVKAVIAVKNWIQNNETLRKGLAKVKEFVTSSGSAIKAWFDGLKETDNIPKYILSGLVNGIKSGIKLAVDSMLELGKALLNAIKKILGIHSPSTEFFEIGSNIIQGLINGLKNGASAVFEFIKGIGSKIVDLLKGIDFGKVFAATLGVGMFAVTAGIVDTAHKVATAIENVSNMADGFGDMMRDLGKMFKGIGKSIAANRYKKIGSMIKDIAIAIGILAASLYLISKIDPDRLWQSVGVIAAIAGIIAILAVTMTTFTKSQNAIDMASIAMLIAGIGFAMMTITSSLKKLSGIENVDQALWAMSAMLIGIIAVCAAAGKAAKAAGGNDISKIGKMLTKLAVALLLMLIVIKLIAKMDPEDIGKGVLVITLFGIIFTGLIAATRLAGKEIDKVGATLIKMSIAMGLMVFVIKLIAKIPESDISKGISTMAKFGLLFAEFLIITRIAGGKNSNAVSSLLMMAGAVLIMFLVIKLISGMDPKDIEKGLDVIERLGILFAGLILVSKFAGQNAARAGVMLLMASGALLIVTGILFIISKMNPEGLGRSLAIIAVLETLFGGLIAVSKLAENVKMGTIIAFCIAIVVLVGALVGLTFLDPQKLEKAVLALSALMLSFGGLLASISKLGSMSKGVLGTLATMIIVVVLLAGILIGMSFLTDSSGLIQNAIALGVLLNAMAAAMIILDQVKSVSMSSIGAMAVLALVVAELAVILGLMAYLDVAPSMETALALSTLLIAMAVVLDLITLAGMAGPAAFVGIGALSALIAAMAVVLVALGALMSIPGVQEFVDNGVAMMGKIGEAIGSFFGGLVAGFASEMMAILPDLGTALSQFMVNATPFIMGAKLVDADVLAGVGIMTAAIIALTVADLVAAIGTFLSGASFADLGTQLSLFMINAIPFIMGIKLLDSESVSAAKALAETILILTAADLLDGISNFLHLGSGDSSMERMGEHLATFGKAVVGFSNIVSGNIDVECVTAATNAGKTIAELYSALPKGGGWVQGIFGEAMSLSEFGTQLKDFGAAIVGFDAALKANGGIDSEMVTAAANAGKTIAELYDTLPKGGGWVQGIFGESMSLSTFGTQLKDFGEAIVKFDKVLKDNGGIDSEMVTAAANAGKTIASLYDELPEGGGWVQGIFGEAMSLSTFGTQLKDFGEAIVKFDTALKANGGIDPEMVNAAVNSGKAIAGLYDALPTGGGWITEIFGGESMSLTEFGTQLKDFGSAMKGFSDNVSGLVPANILAAADSAKTIAMMCAWDLGGINYENLTKFKNELPSIGTAIKNFGDNLKNVNTSAIKNKVETFKTVFENLKTILRNGLSAVSSQITESEDSIIDAIGDLAAALHEKNSAFKDAGGVITQALLDGLESKNSSIKTVYNRQLVRLISELSNFVDDFESSGKDLGDGLINGINAKQQEVYDAAYALGQKAVQGEKDGQASNSPSKLTYKSGIWFGEGLVNGIHHMSSDVYGEAKNLGTTATGGLSKAIAKISDVINSDIDTQPTIRPVLDLSGVAAGAGRINGMFDMNPSVGVMANVRSINSSMANRQNGVNRDVVSAIKDLGRQLGNTSGDTYNINGVTYDDGSNVSNAVKDLIRAARIERRR